MSILEQAPETPARIEIENSDGFAVRQLILDDSQPLFDLIDSNRPHLSQNHNGEPDITADKYQTAYDVKESILHPKDPRKLRFGMWDGNALVGSNNLTPLDDQGFAVESGSWVGKQHAGHNYAARGRELLMDLVFNRLGYKLMVSDIAVHNEASRKSVEKSGFHFKEIVQKPDKKGIKHDYWRYELTSEEYYDRSPV